MKKFFLFSALCVVLIGSAAPLTAFMRKSDDTLLVCSVCTKVIPNKSVQLSCNHEVCADCLQSWLKENVKCLRCHEKKQRMLLIQERKQSFFRIGLGMAIGAAAIGVKKLDDRLSLSSARKYYLPT